MGRKLDLTGQTYNELTVIKEVPAPEGRKKTYKKVYWLCKCSCGNETIVSSEDLRSNHTKSCGCKQIRRNVYDLTGEYGVGYDINGNTFTFDLEDYNLIKDYCWYVKKYGRTNNKGFSVGEEEYVLTASPNIYNLNSIRLHRLIMNVVDNSEICVDHIDSNGCNNRKSNLRTCTKGENHWNLKPRKNTSSKYKGVYYDKASQKWGAQITKNGEYHYLGRFDTEIAAATAYNNAATELFGEFARLNEIHYNNEIKEITN